MQGADQCLDICLVPGELRQKLSEESSVVRALPHPGSGGTGRLMPPDPM
ncbi:hypothetical protein ACH4TQ_11300 [Streptomyces sp. NPDC021218]